MQPDVDWSAGNFALCRAVVLCAERRVLREYRPGERNGRERLRARAVQLRTTSFGPGSRQRRQPALRSAAEKRHKGRHPSARDGEFHPRLRLQLLERCRRRGAAECDRHFNDLPRQLRVPFADGCSIAIQSRQPHLKLLLSEHPVARLRRADPGELGRRRPERSVDL